ncbi:MAG: hypothetical protein V1845_01430 [bacterium]
MDKGKELLVCVPCGAAIVIESAANKAPKWESNLASHEELVEVNNQDDFSAFTLTHKSHNVITARLG